MSFWCVAIGLIRLKKRSLRVWEREKIELQTEWSIYNIESRIISSTHFYPCCGIYLLHTCKWRLFKSTKCAHIAHNFHIPRIWFLLLLLWVFFDNLPLLRLFPSRVSFPLCVFRSPSIPSLFIRHSLRFYQKCHLLNVLFMLHNKHLLVFLNRKVCKNIWQYDFSFLFSPIFRHVCFLHSTFSTLFLTFFNLFVSDAWNRELVLQKNKKQEKKRQTRSSNNTK